MSNMWIYGWVFVLFCFLTFVRAENKIRKEKSEKSQEYW